MGRERTRKNLFRVDKTEKGRSLNKKFFKNTMPLLARRNYIREYEYTLNHSFILKSYNAIKTTNVLKGRIATKIINISKL